MRFIGFFLRYVSIVFPLWCMGRLFLNTRVVRESHVRIFKDGVAFSERLEIRTNNVRTDVSPCRMWFITQEKQGPTYKQAPDMRPWFQRFTYCKFWARRKLLRRTGRVPLPSAFWYQKKRFCTFSFFYTAMSWHLKLVMSCMSWQMSRHLSRGNCVTMLICRSACSGVVDSSTINHRILYFSTIARVDGQWPYSKRLSENTRFLPQLGWYASPHHPPWSASCSCAATGWLIIICHAKPRCYLRWF